MARKKNKSGTLTKAQPSQDPNSVVQHRIQAATYSGPLPPPDVLIRYNEAVPDAAERILAMAENQAAHRQQIEKRVIESDAGNSRMGLWFGLIIALAGLAGSVWCIQSGHQIGGSVLGGGTLASLVGVFVYGSSSRRKEREGRWQSASGQGK